MHVLSQEGSLRKCLLEKQNYEGEKQKEKAHVADKIYHDELFLGDDALV